MVAEVPVEEGSALVGKPIRTVGLPVHTRVLAVQPEVGAELQWQPDPETLLAAGNQLVVVSNRYGLDDLLAHSTVGATPEPGDDDPAEADPAIA
nr:TrkA C-terminal domain-containing protein [Nocardia transvalensis]